MVSGHLGTTTPKCPPKLNIGQMDRDGWTYGVAMDGWLDGPPPSTRHVSAQVMCAPTWLTPHYCSVTGMPCHAMPCHSILHHAIPYYTMPGYHAMPPMVSCHVMPMVSCHVMPVPCHAHGVMPTVSCHAPMAPYSTMPFHATP